MRDPDGSVAIALRDEEASQPVKAQINSNQFKSSETTALSQYQTKDSSLLSLSHPWSPATH
jgi:hypothetical protein